MIPGQGKVYQVNEFEAHKSNIIFKIHIFKLIEKYLKLMKSSIGLGFLKNQYKDIKQICEENSKEFEYVKVIFLRKLFKNFIEIFRHTLQQMLQDF